MYVYSVIKLCKNKKIPVAYESLNIQSKCLKELLKFVIDKTPIKFDESFFSSLSKDNKCYVLKNLIKPGSISVSEKNYSQISEIKNNKESVEVLNEKYLEENVKIEKSQQISYDHIENETSKLCEDEKKKLDDSFEIY